MDRSERKQVVDLLKTIKTAIQHAKLNISKSQPLIDDSSEALKSIADFLMEKESDYNLESILKCREDLKKYSKLDKVNKKRSLISLEKSIEKLIKSISEVKKKEKIKAVFLPYKVSMWTSLESIWKAADADENCEAVVVPIPYHDLDEERNKVKICYEGEEYPDYVPVTKFWKYDITAEKPDIIFIHNPYDDYNTLTRVSEEYYSRNLKKYTGKLVYVPYHVTYMFDMRKNFVIFNSNSPSFKYIDRIIVENDLVKEKYEQVESNVGKVLALGSPKLDSIYEIREHGIKGDNKLQEKVTGKKVFLLITTLGFYSRQGKKAFEAVIEIYNQVMKNKDCILIWRPHPLEENWIKNSMSVMYPVYSDIKTLFNNDDNVLIDLSPSYKETIYIADGVFSCDSSMVSEIMAMGKSLYLIEDDSFLDEENHLLFDNYIHYNVSRDDMSKYIYDVISGKEEGLYFKRVKSLSGEVKNIENGDSGQKIYETMKSEILNGM